MSFDDAIVGLEQQDAASLLLREWWPIVVALVLGVLTSVLIVTRHLGGGMSDKKKKQRRPLIVSFFDEANKKDSDKSSDASGAAGAAGGAFHPMLLVRRRLDTHDTIVLSFALPHHGKVSSAATLQQQKQAVNGGDDDAENTGTSALGPCGARARALLQQLAVYEVAGIGPSKHVQVRATIAGEVVQRSFSPTSCCLDEAHHGLLDLHIKVYPPQPDRGIPGGRMGTYLATLPIGSTVDMRGPTGLVEYIGCGRFVTGTPAKRRVVQGTHLVLIAGGSGATPIIAVLKALLHGKLGGAAAPSPAHRMVLPAASPTTAANAVATFAKAATSSSPSRASSVSEEVEKEEGAADDNECRHSFYEDAPMNVPEDGSSSSSGADSSAVERVTILLSNHSVDDIMFRRWLQGSDAEHQCYGAFAALAAAGGVSTQQCAEQNTNNKNNTKKKDTKKRAPIACDIRYFVSRPTAADQATMTAKNATWAAAEDALFAPASASASVSVSQRYVHGRITAEAIGEVVKGSGAEGGGRASAVVALLCGPKGLLDDVCKPALLQAGVPKEHVLLA